jgi:alpha-1,2-mannosyltransferase
LVQLLATLGAAASVILAFRSGLSTLEKIAVLLAATVLAAPHSGAYDATLLTIAAAFWMMTRGGLQPSWHWTLTFMIWLVPIVSPPISSVAGRFAPLLMVALIVLILRSPASHPSPVHARQ